MKLNLGAGHSQLDGWTSVDIDPASGAQVIDDIAVLSSIPDGSCREIMCCHALEHIYRPQVLPTLRIWCTKLKPGGKLTLYLPDVRKFWQKYLSGHMGEKRLLDVTYGVQGGDNPWAVHKTAFWPERITMLLQGSGFQSVGPIPPRFDTEFGVTAVKPPL
ncbi:MAG: hypothetical protein KAV00_03280 [Phycisphaerae bacterium]|nr:hypothetical protein [Phycisphaerae bacterium]